MYVIKAFTYDSEFYGYFAAHPEDENNEMYSYYVEELEDAKKFESYEEAKNMIERFQDSSELEFLIQTI